MDNIKLYDDIDDPVEPFLRKISSEDSISKFCIAILDITKNKYKGSGVILTPSGLFVSVAHNFDRPDTNYIAYYNQKLYMIEFLCKEYEQGKTDLAIGRLINFIPTEVDRELYPLLISCEHLSVGEKVNISGFKSQELPEAEILERITLHDGLNLCKQRISKKVPVADISQEIVLKEYEGKAKVYMERVGAEKYCGFSGGPVYSNQNLYGLVISHFFIKSDYIKLKLLELDIHK